MKQTTVTFLAGEAELRCGWGRHARKYQKAAGIDSYYSVGYYWLAVKLWCVYLIAAWII